MRLLFLLCFCTTLVVSSCTKTIIKTVEKVRIDTLIIYKEKKNFLDKNNEKTGYWEENQASGYYFKGSKVGLWTYQSKNSFEQIIYKVDTNKYDFANQKRQRILSISNNEVKETFLLNDETLIIDYYISGQLKSILHMKKGYIPSHNDPTMINTHKIYDSLGNLKFQKEYPKQGIFYGTPMNGDNSIPKYKMIEYYPKLDYSDDLKIKSQGNVGVAVSDGIEEVKFDTWQYFSEKGKLIKEEFYQYGKLIKMKMYEK